MADVITTDKEVKDTTKMPRITKQNIKVSGYEGIWRSDYREGKEEISSNHRPTTRKYIETAKSTYSNGIWKITFAKKAKSIERESKVD